MRGPTRLHITWQDDNTLKLETDYGTADALLRFGAAAACHRSEAWQGDTSAEWTGARRRPRAHSASDR